MTFLDAAVFSIMPVLAAIIAAALILPRSWLAFYAALVIGAGIVCTGYSSRHDDAAMSGVLSTLVGLLMVAALAAGLAARWALKGRWPQAD